MKKLSLREVMSLSVTEGINGGWEIDKYKQKSSVLIGPCYFYEKFLSPSFFIIKSVKQAHLFLGKDLGAL